jgi:SSS family solute:Na+ symporter
MIPVFGLMYIGDGSIAAGIEALYANDPSKFKAMGASDSAIPFSTLFTGMVLVQLFYWGTNQAIIQRALGAKNLVEGQKGLILAAFIKILGPLIVVLPGLIAFYIFGDTLDPSQGDQSYGMLVNKVLPPVLLGFFAAVLFGAILSSFNSALNSSVTLFGLDIYKQYINKEASEVQVVRAGKAFGIGLAVLSMVIAPSIANAPEGLFGYLQEINGCYTIPILTIILVGYLTKYVPPVAAKIAMGVGVVMYSFSQFFLKGYVEAGGGEYPHYLHIMAIIFLFNIGLMLLIGKLKPRAEAYEQQYTKQVDITEWKPVRLMGLIITVIVISTYFIFT